MSFSPSRPRQLDRFRSNRRKAKRKGPATTASTPRRITFEALEDRMLLTNFAVLNTLDSGAGSFRQAIVDANTNPGAGLIDFNIGGGGAQTIQPLSALPTIIDPVTIDGTTQPGYVDTPIIALDGSLAGAGVRGLIVQAGDSTIRGLAIDHYSSNALMLHTNGRNLVEDDVIGANMSATAVLLVNSNGNSLANLTLSSSAGPTGTGLGMTNNTIENVTATNRRTALSIGGAGSGGNLVQNNNFSDSWTGISYSGTGGGNQYLDNDLSNTPGVGLQLASEESFRVAGNIFTNSAGVTLNNMDGLILSAGPDFDIDVSMASSGLKLVNVTNSHISGLDLSSSAGRTGTGIAMSWCSNNTIENVTVTNRGAGISLGASNANTAARPAAATKAVSYQQSAISSQGLARQTRTNCRPRSVDSTGFRTTT